MTRRRVNPSCCNSNKRILGAPSLLINLAGMLFDGGGKQSLLTQHKRPVVTQT